MDFKDYLNKKIKEDPKFGERYCKKDLANLLISIGNEVEKERIKNNIRQSELAKKLQTSQSYISRLENGSLSPSIKMLQKIAEVFDGFVDFKISYNNGRNNTINQDISFKIKSIYEVDLGELVPSYTIGTESLKTKAKSLIS